jgi:hypothetical protein
MRLVSPPVMTSNWNECTTPCAQCNADIKLYDSLYGSTGLGFKQTHQIQTRSHRKSSTKDRIRR